jgi:hypothetical protein
MMMQRGKGLSVASWVFALCLTSPAGAQASYSSRVGIEPRHSERALTPRSDFSRDAADSLPTAASWQYPLIGALAGAGVGLTAAFIATHQRHIKDHSEDGFVYMTMVPFGAVTGLLSGCIVYLVRRH